MNISSAPKAYIESDILEHLVQNKHLFTLPNSLWGMHIDAKYKFVAFLHLKEIFFDKIIIDKAVVLKNDINSSIKSTLFINNDAIIIPELNQPIRTLSDISQLIFVFDTIKLCCNSLDVENVNCKKYVNLEDTDGSICSNCSCRMLKIDESKQLGFFESLPGEYFTARIEERTCSNENSVNFSTYNCKSCDKNFNSNLDYENHLKEHKSNGPYVCNVCSKTNLVKSSHLKHLLTHTKTKQFLCSTCGKCFSRKYRLEEHLTSHTSKKLFECSICFKTFSTSNNLKIHQRIHTGDRPYVCSTCGKTYTTPSNLSTHVKSSHSNKKPHACGLCDMTFVHPRMLRIHMRKHTGEKPFHCLICNKTFAKNIHLTVHMRTHTGEKPYACTICGKSFTTTGNLNSHKRIHHEKTNL